MNIADARSKLAAALAPITGTDPDVLVSLVDTIEPPALMLGWGDPWLEPTTSCWQQGRMVVTAVAGRMAPGDGVAKLEDLVAYVLGRLAADSSAWPLASVSGPRVITMAKTNYLAARITVRVTITS
jgi:hypothetical protein